MDLGIMIPQGYLLEYRNWAPADAWDRSLAIARQAEVLGFSSLWVVDHFQTNPSPEEELTFESFTMLACLAAFTKRVRLGHLVACAGYRNPALVAKMIGTMDVMARGRMTLGIGAGWKEDEWRAYGYGFPATGERLAALGDSLQVIAAMFAPGRATFTGRYCSVVDAVNLPRGLQEPRIPIMVGGNGPNVTWRLAARFADELNLDGLSPLQVAEAIPVIASRCEEVGRDPSSLRISVQVWSDRMAIEGTERTDLFGAYRELGVSALMGLPPAVVEDAGALERLADDARAAGVSLMDG